MSRRRPKITLTYAQSADGRIATADGHSQWISGDQTLELAHQLRSEHNAIMVGAGTVLADDPQLTCRIPGGRNPHRIVLDSSLRTPTHSHIVTQAADVPTTIFCSQTAVDGAEEFRERGVVIRPLPVDSLRGALALVLQALVDDGVGSVLVEGGARLLTSFFAARAVDRLVLVCAPMIIGDGTQAVGDLGTVRLDAAWRGKTHSVRQAGDDIVWEIRFEHE